MVCLASHVSAIDSGISQTIQNASKLSMGKVLEQGKTEMKVSVEKEQGKRNSFDLWEKNGFFSSQVCDFSLEKTNLPESTIFYINQSYLNYKDNKKIYHTDLSITWQIVPLLNQQEDLEQYVSKDNEVKLLRAKYDMTTGNFLGMENCLAYLTVCGDFHEQFFDYDYSKDNSKILYSVQKLKVPNSFTSTIFNKHRIQYESGVFSETDFSDVLFFLPSTVDRIEKINRCLGSVNLNPIDIEIDKFSKKFDPSKLD